MSELFRLKFHSICICFGLSQFEFYFCHVPEYFCSFGSLPGFCEKGTSDHVSLCLLI
jgi:hypothetical protein